MKNNTKIKVPKKYQHMIKEIDKENYGTGIWVYLEKGFYCPEMGCHTIHEYNQADILKMIRTIETCDCDACTDSNTGFIR